MKRSSAWYLAVLIAPFLAVGCGGESEAGEGEMAATAEGMGETADSGLACVVMGDVEGRQSPLQELSFSYEGGEGLLCYGAPSARERVVMGDLVPYGEVWRLGANEATALHLSAAATVGGVALAAGSYSLYATPGEDEWAFHLNSEYERWGIPIDAAVQSTEVGSFSATPSGTGDMVEMMSFEHADGALRFSWENTQVDIPLGM